MIQCDPKDPADHDLVPKCLDHDEGAWSVLYDRYGEAFFRACFAASGDVHHAEDLSSEVWGRIQRGLPGFRLESKFRTWAYTIVRNVIADWIGRERKRRERESEPPEVSEGEESEGLTNFPETGQDPWPRIEGLERLDLAFQVLKELTPDCQAALKLRWEGFTDLEIAEILGSHPKAMEARRARCEARFFKRVQEIERSTGLSS